MKNKSFLPWASMVLLVMSLATSLAQAEPNASCLEAESLQGGRSYQVKLPTKDGFDISFQVMEPVQINCANSAKGAHPLLLHGPGYSGGRATSGFDNYRADGYTVISWDPPGFGDSGGTARGMDPEYEGQYYLQILDWAEQNLDYLAWRYEGKEKEIPGSGNARGIDANSPACQSDQIMCPGEYVARPVNGTSVADGVNLVLGSLGGSYGGGYQLMLLTVDHRKRLDAIVPDITWHDMRHSLNPGDAVKSMWGVILSAGGLGQGAASSGGGPQDGQDMYINETVVRAAATNEWPRRSLDWFQYRGIGYWCAVHGLPAMPYPVYNAPERAPMVDATNSYNVPPRKADGSPSIGPVLVAASEPATYFEGLDVLLTQGIIDPLFNFNESWWNAQCLSAAGANVSLYTHNGGHVLPGVQAPDKLPANTNRCDYDTKAWLDARLKPEGQPLELAETCFALGQGDDTVTLPRAEVLAPLANQQFTNIEVVPVAPVPNGISGAIHESGNLPVHAPLGTVVAEGVLAGIPRISLTVSSITGANEMAQDCSNPALPTRTGCDSTIFVGVGVKRGNSPPTYGLVDDQLTPLRGLGTHEVDLVGIAERLLPGDELALVFYAAHPQFVIAASRDASIPAVLVTGTVGLPLYAVGENGALSSATAGSVFGAP